MEIIWTRPSVKDLENIHAFISKDSKRYADIFINKIIITAEKISGMSGMGRVVPERNDETIREIIFQNYRIIYKVKDNTINILTVCHGSRDLSNWDAKVQS